MRFWDRYSVWIVAYVYLLTRAFITDADDESVWLHAFLLLNLMASIGVGYLALLRRFPTFRVWAPLVLRWVARFMLYEFLWVILVGIFTPLSAICPIWIISVVIPGMLVARLAVHDIRKLRKSRSILL